MLAWVRRLFPTQADFLHYLLILSACAAGLAGLSWWFSALPASVFLSLSTWPRWRELGWRAKRADSEWRDLGLPHEAKAERMFWLTMGAAFVNNLFFTSLAYVFGRVLVWLWGAGA